MRGSRWVASLLLLGALSACGNGAGPGRPDLRLGAARPETSAPPRHGMDDLERPVARRLAPRLEDDGLTLQYVECPRWAGALPTALRCKAYVDGVVGEVVVKLAHRAAGRVEFDAHLRQGVLATPRLVERLEKDGYRGVDCGRTPAYPSRVGMRIVCRVHRDGEMSHVVATVVDHQGAVRIEGY